MKICKYYKKITFYLHISEKSVIFAGEMEEHREEHRERAVLVGLITPMQNAERTAEYLNELAFLADTRGIDAIKRFVQRVVAPDRATYIGKGKVEEIRQYLIAQQDAETAIDLVIFDDELSPKQLRNIERALNWRDDKRERCEVRVMDRTILILEIFLRRAQTSYAKTQVEIAHLQYMLPRLTRMWSHLDRQHGGGGGTNRGTGETQIEADRRIIANRIALLKEELKKIDRQMATQRQNRGKLVRVALVGYTNVGKSTLMTVLSKSEVFAENKLFATLDTTVRKVTIENLPFLLTDTVGFIRKLPHHLVESFKSTLDEVREADLLLHIVDISHPNFAEQYAVVEQTLKDLRGSSAEGEDVPTIVVFNKTDQYTYIPKDDDDLTPLEPWNRTLHEVESEWRQRLEAQGNDVVFISAKMKDGLDELKEVLYRRIREIHITRFPHDDFLYPDITSTSNN